MENIKEVISKNIQKLRKQKKYTQLELAEKLNYSDKAISRWENGEVLPDVETLNNVAEVFNIDIRDLFNEDLNPENVQTLNKQQKYNKLIIVLLSVCAVWILATVTYVYTNLINGLLYWQIFVYAIPATALVTMLFSSVWKLRLSNIIAQSLFVWSTLAAVYLSFIEYNMWVIFILGAPIQMAVVLWSKIRIKK